MKKLRGILLIALAAILAWVASSIKWTEPRYHFRPISYWLAKYGEGPADYTPSPEADYALRQMGSNAVPYLLNLLHSTNSYSYHTFVGKPAIWISWGTRSFRTRLLTWWINTRYRFQRVTVPPNWDHWRVYLAFQALGREGKSAIPDLVEVANDASTNSSPSNTGEAPLISFWSDRKTVAVFAAQSSTYSLRRVPVLSFGGLIPQPFLSDGEIAAWSLAAIGSDSIPPLIGMLTNSNPQIRCRAAMALGMAGKAAEQAVPALVNALNDPDKNTRNKAADALGCIGQKPNLVVPALVNLLGNQDLEFSAIMALGNFGERATNAVPALLSMLIQADDSGDQTRGQYTLGYAAAALNQISAEAARREVIPLLNTRIQRARVPWTRYMTLDVLGVMTNQADMVIPIVLNALDKTDDYTRNTAIYRLAGFGSAARAAVPKLVAISTSQDTNLCRIASNALDKIDPEWRKKRH